MAGDIRMQEFFLNSIYPHMGYVIRLVPQMIEGTGMTLFLFFVTIVLSIPLGLAISLARISKFKWLSNITGAYIWLLRGTPLLLQLFFVYYGLPVFGIVLERVPAAVIAFVLNYAAYFAEIFRAGIQSIDRGQYEGAKALGLSYWQTMRRIILPQVTKRVLPPVSNETITLVKDTALVYAIGLGELLRVSKTAVNRDANTTAFIVAAVFYLIMTYVLTKIFQRLEKRYAVYE